MSFWAGWHPLSCPKESLWDYCLSVEARGRSRSEHSPAVPGQVAGSRPSLPPGVGDRVTVGFDTSLPPHAGPDTCRDPFFSLLGGQAPLLITTPLPPAPFPFPKSHNSHSLSQPPSHSCSFAVFIIYHPYNAPGEIQALMSYSGKCYDCPATTLSHPGQ